MESEHIETLKSLFIDWVHEEATEVIPLAQGGSGRLYFRLKSRNTKALGAFSPEKRETEAFISFTNHFRQMGLNVPEIYLKNSAKNCYLLTDLGDETLLSHLEKHRIDGKPSPETRLLYKAAVAELPRFQVDASKNLNFLLCYPTSVFDGRSIRWDLNYFKYSFLRLMKIPFDEASLEDDFDRLTLYLLRNEKHYFMYRDFQARNILIHDGQPWFIDYQGGRRGPLQYDLASLLFQVKASLPGDFREEMLYWYLQNLKKFIAVNDQKFIKSYYGFVLIRLMQVMGAYFYRGYFERKAHFLQSIPYAIESIRWFLENVKLGIELPELFLTLQNIAEQDITIPIIRDKQCLTISINSFSYKDTLPLDYSGNGGGFIFDCRALPNPGRLDEFKKLTGIDPSVKRFLETNTQVNTFMKYVYELISQSIQEYKQRGFRHLQVDFGCTGGQHRSVYAAQKLAEMLEPDRSLNIDVSHHSLE